MLANYKSDAMVGYFSYLDKMMLGGNIVSLGGSNLLRKEFKLDSVESKKIFHAWLNSYRDEIPEKERATATCS